MPFTRALRQRVLELLKNDEEIVSLERRRQEERARKSSSDLSERMTTFLSSIVSDAVAQPGIRSGADAPGERHVGPKLPRPEIPAADPPQILCFLGTGPAYVPLGSAMLVKFMSDARPPKYSFHGDNPRCFARLELNDDSSRALILSGKADIDQRGYGSVTLTSTQSQGPEGVIGTLIVSIQGTDGRTLEARLEVGLRPAIEVRHRRHQPAVKLEIRFCAPDAEDIDELKSLFGEDNIVEFGEPYLGAYRDALKVAEPECAYWGAKTELEGVSKLVVEVNAAHPQLKRLLRGCRTAEDRVRTKERIVQDIVLDCYQHQFRLENLPKTVHDEISSETDESKRAAEICLNFDKAVRIAIVEREKVDRGRATVNTAPTLTAV
jgi:hypothetical protein